MPETASTGDKFQVRVRGTIEGQETNNIFHFQAATPIDDVELRLIVALVDCFITHLLPVVTSAWSIKDVVWKRVNPTLGVEHVFVPTGTLTGAGSAQALPSFNSAVVSIRTALGGKSRRGRFYLAGIPEPATLGSLFDTGHAFWTAVIAFAGCLASKFILADPPPANSFQYMVYSRKLGGSTFPYGNAGFTSVAEIKPVVALGTTRSRKVGVGS
jgi:hypothetical protein